MNFPVSGVLATAAIFALSSAASAQSTTNYYQQIQSGYQQGVIAPAATSTFQATPSAPLSGVFAAQPATAYAPQPLGNFAQPAASSYAPQQLETSYLPAPTTSASTLQQPTAAFSATVPSYGSPYTPTTQAGYAPSVAPTYVAPTYGTANGAYQGQQLPGYQVQQLPAYQQPAFNLPVAQQPAQAPANAYAPITPAAAKPSNSLRDSDAWSFNLARFYPAIQACLRKSSAKNPVIANVQVSDNKTKMLIGEGGSSSFSTCSTGLSGTVVKANSDIRTLPPAFFAPLGSTFTVSPDRPFQPIVDTDQKVIGWLVRTQPTTTTVNQFGQAPSFDGQFIRPMMVNTSVGKG